MNNWNPRAQLTAGWLLVALLATFFVAAGGPAAHALDPEQSDCALEHVSTEQGVSGTERESLNGQLQTGLRGERADIKVLETDDCQIIDSVYIRSNNGVGGVEIGTQSGFSTCGPYRDIPFATPVLFWAAYNSNGAPAGCRVFPTIHPPTGSYAEFEVSDSAGDNTWNITYNGVNRDTVTVNFGDGYGLIAQERQPSDPGAGRFHEVQEYGSYLGWGRWDWLTRGPDHDTAFAMQVPNGYTGNICLKSGC